MYIFTELTGKGDSATEHLADPTSLEIVVEPPPGGRLSKAL